MYVWMFSIVLFNKFLFAETKAKRFAIDLILNHLSYYVNFAILYSSSKFLSDYERKEVSLS